MPHLRNLPHKPETIQHTANAIVRTLDDRGQRYLVEDGILTLPCPHELAGMCRLRRRCVWTLRWSQHDARLVFEHNHLSRCGYRSDDLAAVLGLDTDTLSFPDMLALRFGTRNQEELVNLQLYIMDAEYEKGRRSQIREMAEERERLASGEPGSYKGNITKQRGQR